MSATLSFPFRAETAEVLQWVIAQDNTWKPKYYLGLIQWSRQDTLQAKELFAEMEMRWWLQQAEQLDGD